MTSAAGKPAKKPGKPRGPQARVSAATREKVMLCYEAGMGRNAIAKALGVTTVTVSNIVHAEGGTFDTTHTVKMTQARLDALAAKRAYLAEKFAEVAAGRLESVDQPHLAFNFGGKDNTYEEHTLDRPPSAALRDLIQAASIAAQRSLELSKYDHDPNSSSSAVDSWLRYMMGEGEE